jgi:4-hydroxy-4-methyl-2-oxoglutarate aldolase
MTSTTAFADALKQLAQLPVATVYEAAGKLGDVAPHIRSLVDGVKLAGPAFTLKTMPGDNLGVFAAIDAAPAGSVLVIDGGGAERVTIWGGTSTVAARAKGLVGCVTNAAVRDIEEIRESRFPVFAPCTSVRGVSRSHPGWLSIPVSIGDAIVRPGDIMLGDGDGLLVVPAERVVEIAAAAMERRKVEQAKDARLRAGEPIKRVMNLA